MNRPSNYELANNNAYFKDEDGYEDSDFRAYARLLQSRWRKDKGYKEGVYIEIDKKTGEIIKRGNKTYGNYITEKDAENGNNFITPKIWSIAKEEIKNRHNNGVLYEYTFINNLLSSQALCFNLFAEFLDHKDDLSKIFNKLKPNLMDKITEIKFEYSPGCLGDNTAFDVFIEYCKNNERSFLGIEMKYSEILLEKNPKNAKKNADKEEYYFNNHPQYKKITEDSDLFKPNIIEYIKKPPYSQIWRDHLLSISLKYKNYKNGYFVFLCPFNNTECHTGITDYMKIFLNNPEESIFVLFVEDLIKTIKKEYVDNPWANELYNRYIKGL